MVNHEKIKKQVEGSAGTYLSAIELVSGAIKHLSGRDISGNTPNGDYRDNFGREIIAAKINAEIEGRIGGTK